jgi:1-acyl-sn-glycerol-3-phosphate acyltransferase
MNLVTNETRGDRTGDLQETGRLRRRAADLGYAGYAVSSAFLFWIASWLAVAVLPRLSWRWAVVQRASRWMWRSTFTPLTVTGAENFPRDGRCVIVANHSSYLDSIVLAAVLPTPVSFVAMVELKRNPLFHFYLRRLDTEFVDRWNKRRREEDTRRIIGRAKENRTLVFFAEGGMSHHRGIRRFKLGAFTAAVESGLPVVPVVIRGTRFKLPPGARAVRPGAIDVNVGTSIDVRRVREETGSDDGWLIARRLREITREYILRCSREPDLGDGAV